MGYHTEFDGRFTLNKQLDVDTLNFLKKFAASRRMKRKNLGPEFGHEGALYVGEENNDYGNRTIENYNLPPAGQPGLWCQWVPSEDGRYIEWDGGEKFYNYVEWIKYIIVNFLAPKGYILNGEVRWDGEERGDLGTIVIKDNVVTTENR